MHSPAWPEVEVSRTIHPSVLNMSGAADDLAFNLSLPQGSINRRSFDLRRTLNRRQNSAVLEERRTSRINSDDKPRTLRTKLSTWKRLYGLPRWYEYFVSVDNFPIWRRHLAWSHHDGDKLRDHMTQRFASNMVFMALLLTSDVAVLFSPSNPSEKMRQGLLSGNIYDLNYWAGVLVCTSLFLIFVSLVATFSAWAMVSSIAANNAHSILRSSVGLYATQLPSRTIVLSIYAFYTWAILFMFILMPRVWALVLVSVFSTVLFHIFSTYSAFGRLIMYTNAMSRKRILTVREEEVLSHGELFDTLLDKAFDERSKRISLNDRYSRETIVRMTSIRDLESGSDQGSQRTEVRKPQDENGDRTKSSNTQDIGSIAVFSAG